MTDKITQKNITVTNGNVAGRDQYNTTIEINGSVSLMTSLSLSFMEEAKKNVTFNSILPELEHYMSSIDVGVVIGLEAKLLAANKSEDLEEAKRQKEIIAKKLHRHATSKSAQQIYTYILGMILNNFRIHIKPLIDAGEKKQEIDKVIMSHVIQPVFDKLEQNVLDIFWDDIWGMIYYLTGNCHIKWAK